MSMRPWSIAARLTVWYALTAFVLVSAAVWLQYRALARDLASEDDQLVLETATAVQRDLSRRMHATRAADVPVRDVIRSLGDWTSGPTPAGGPWFRLLDAACRTVGAHDRELPPPDCGISSIDRPHLRSWVGLEGRLWRIATTPIDTTGLVLEVLLDRSTDVGVLARFRRQLYLLLFSALIVAVLLGLVIARQGLAPLTYLATRVARIDAASLDQRLHVASAPPEVRALSESFDRMLAGLERAFDALSSYSAEIAHELRTPVHVLRQQFEVTLNRSRTPEEYRDVLGSGLEELDRLRRMTDDMLFLARAEDPRVGVRCEALNVGEELGSVRDFMEAIAEANGVSVIVEAPADLVIEADRNLLRRALVNLVSNALAHTPPEGVVSLVGRGSAASVTLVVEDTGKGISSDALPRVFERYYRAADAAQSQRVGAGLGLAIVQSIARLHGGTATAESDTGRGTRIRLEFPVVRTPAGPSAPT